MVGAYTAVDLAKISLSLEETPSEDNKLSRASEMPCNGGDAISWCIGSVSHDAGPVVAALEPVSEVARHKPFSSSPRVGSEDSAQR